jgi:hypothetical protein
MALTALGLYALWFAPRAWRTGCGGAFLGNVAENLLR